MKSTLFVNGRFLIPGGVTGQPAPTALLAQGGRIVSLGSEGANGRPDEVIDLGGRVVIPGPVDAHCHLVSYGMICRREADLRGVTSLAELGERLRAHAAALGIRPGDRRWLLGRGFEQDRLTDLDPQVGWPTRDDLDAIAGEAVAGIPVRITRVCGHALVANSAALRAAGLDPSTRNGDFPVGVLTETAMEPIFAATPEPTAAEWLDAARFACAEAARVGYVGVHSLMAHSAEMRALVDLRAEGPLPVRVQMQPLFSLLSSLAESGLRTGYGDDYLTYGAVKLFSDGSLGARTAAMHAPYTDDAFTVGELIYEPEVLRSHVRAIYDAGFQVTIHAIGDRAMDVCLDAIEATSSAYPDHPWPARIEHASVVNPSIVARMKRLGVAAAIQPQFARSDYWSPERLGAERVAGCYAFRTLWEAGITLAGSTDCPVEELSAMQAIGCLVSRPDWSPDERIPLEETLRIFSEGSYRIRGLDPVLGQLAAGGYADFVALETDPREVAAAEIEQIGVALTVVGGQVVYCQSGATAL